MQSASKKSTFALYLGNRGFFPASLMASARTEMVDALKALGHETLVMDPSATRYGAVETPAEGAKYAKWLKENEGKFDGVVLCLPNFGDETGAVAALKDAGVPIWIQAYPDEMDKMAPALRRDSFCGKLSIMDVFYQNNVKFTALPPHTVAPGTSAFAENVDYFDRVCRVTSGMKNMVVRIDELALQRNGITMETFDLSDVFARMRAVEASGSAYRDKAETLSNYANFSAVPAEAFDNIVRLGVVLDALVEEANLDAFALRCWIELQQQLRISPCVLMSEINDRGIPAACEVDVGNAVAMFALSRASGEPPICLDWNNNYGDADDKCILFHCGPVPQSLMTAKGNVTGHAILENAVGPNSSWGCNVGRIKPMPFTFSSMMSDSGSLRFYLGEGRFTPDPIPADFFGCAGVAQIDKLQDVLLFIGKNGHRHHVSVTPGRVQAAVKEALGNYLGYDVSVPQG
jgi:L-fucose isomerase-like protein